MFPSQRPQYLHWTPKKPGRSFNEPARILKVVSLQIPYEESAANRRTGLSQFGQAAAVQENYAYSHQTYARSKAEDTFYSGSTFGRKDEEDYITTAEKIQYPPSIVGLFPPSDTSTNIPARSLGLASSNVAWSHSHEHKSGGSSSAREVSLGTNAAGAAAATAGNSKLPIEFTYRNKYAMANFLTKNTRLAAGRGRLDSILDIQSGTTGAGGRPETVEVDEDYDEPSQLTFCSNIEKGVHQLSDKTNKERKLMIKLCNEALERRAANLEYYKDIIQRQKMKYKEQVQNYDPIINKSELEELMLTMATQRQQLIDQASSKPNTAPGTPSTPATCWHQLNYENNGRHYLPVYCLKGKTFLGGPYDHPRQPHTFAPLTALHKLANDPPGYRRYSKIINMAGYKNNEILIHARGNELRFDGFSLRNKPFEPDTAIIKRKSTTIKLPKGVYPERLTIGRNKAGVLVIQEPWKF